MHFGVELPAGVKADVWPANQAPFIRRHPHRDVGDDAVPARDAVAGLYGLVPHWAKDLTIGRHTYNARTETVAEKPSFRDAWRHGQHCIVPAEAIYEPDWHSGKAVPTRITRQDGKPMGIAGLWTSNRKATGQGVLSFTLLTINADGHEIFGHLHKPQDEKRMVVILGEDQYDAWLEAPLARSMDFIKPYAAGLLTMR
jgi:putative SOS response-associated peptidase YedK